MFSFNRQSCHTVLWFTQNLLKRIDPTRNSRLCQPYFRPITEVQAGMVGFAWSGAVGGGRNAKVGLYGAYK